MARLILELTNRCNLRCRHCFAERHAATAELPLAILHTVLRDGKTCGIDHLCFTGGEPSLHRRFPTVVQHVCESEYSFSFVSNGWRFQALAPLLRRFRDRFDGVTFSLDGAREETHDLLRGPGSYRQVMRAVSVCVIERFPFTFNMVLTSENCDQVEEVVDTAVRLGSRGVRFGHLMFNAETAARGLHLSPAGRREIEARIWALQKQAPLHVGMGPGYFSESPFFPCAPLELQEFNVDHRGNVTLCCQLSGHDGPNAADDLVANLNDVSLNEACSRFRARVHKYLADKRRRLDDGEFGELDHFPCWYCVNYLGKVAVDPGAGWIPAHGSPRRLHVITGPHPAGP